MSISYMSHKIKSVNFYDGSVHREVPIVVYEGKEIFRASQHINITINYEDPFQNNINDLVESSYTTPRFIFSYTPPNSSDKILESFEGWSSSGFTVPYGSTDFDVDYEDGLVREITNIDVDNKSYLSTSISENIEIPNINITVTVTMDYYEPLSLTVDTSGEFYQGNIPNAYVEVDNEYAWPGEIVTTSATISNLYYGVDHYTIVGVPHEDVYSVDVIGAVNGYFESELSVREYEEFLSGDLELDTSRSIFVTIFGIADIGFEH